MKKRRLLGFLLCLVVVLAGMPAGSAGASGLFSDVPPTAWYATDVLTLVNRGVIQGTGPDSFSPDAPLSRGAFVTMLCKTMLTPEEISQYGFQGDFSDVPPSHWANPFVNWAAECGVVHGRGDGSFGPDDPVSRQDMAVMAANLTYATGRRLPAVNSPAAFTDSHSISGYAAASVSACQQAGVINGYVDGSFGPLLTATRAEAASMYARFLDRCAPGKYEILRKRVDGVAVRAVEFDPHDFSASLVLGWDTITGRENPGSFISRSGAAIAMNAAFFLMDCYVPLATMVSDGRVILVDNTFAPAKSAFVMRSDGSCSIEGFATRHTAVLHRQADGGESTLEHIVVNQKPAPDDSTRVLFTRDWGTSLTFAAADAVTVSPQGVVTQVLHDADAEIPAEGYVLIQRIPPWTGGGDFFETVQVGDTIDMQRLYEGASGQDIQLCVGVGPRILRDGAPYGDASTFAAEGFTDPGITVYNARRSCIGIKNDGKLVLLTAHTDLATLGRIMARMGCRDAVNCDGGGSTNLFVDGQWLYGPQERPLNHMLVFK